MRVALIASIVVSAVLMGACDSKSPPKGSPAANESLDQVKGLLRGELAAVATYEEAIKKNDAHAWFPELNRILGEHRDAVSRLKTRVTDLGGSADSGSGVWGGWTDLVAKAAAVLGDEPAREALKAGERLGVQSYENALVNAKVDEATKGLIKDTLLVRTREHVTALENLKK